MADRGNPWRYKGRFGSSSKYDTSLYTPKQRRVQYSQSDERDEAAEVEVNRDRQISQSKKEAKRLNNEQKRRDIEKEIKEWKDIQNNPYESPYLKEQSWKKLAQLKKRLEKLK